MKRRGEVYWVNFDRAVGEEIKKTRPCVIVSNNFFNRVVERFQVVPLSSRTARTHPGQCLVNLNDEKSKAVCDQITTVSIKRMGAYFGTVSEAEMKAIETALKTQLSLD